MESAFRRTPNLCFLLLVSLRPLLEPASGSSQLSSGLSSYITSQELKDMFTPFGVVKAARLVRDPKTQKPKGFGFVEFESKVDAQNALKVMNGRMVNGGIVFVEVAETAKAGKERREGHG